MIMGRLRKTQFKDFLRQAISRAGLVPDHIDEAAAIPKCTLNRFLRGDRNLNIDTLKEYIEVLSHSHPGLVMEIVNYFAAAAGGFVVVPPHSGAPADLSLADEVQEACDWIKEAIGAIADRKMTRSEFEEVRGLWHLLAGNVEGQMERLETELETKVSIVA